MPPKWIIANYRFHRQIDTVFVSFAAAVGFLRMIGEGERLGQDRFILPFWNEPSR